MSDRIELTFKQSEKIREHTLNCYPQEMCGFLTEDDFIPVKNTAEEPEKSFRIDTIDYARWFGKAIAVVHSHTRPLKKQELFDLRTPSYADYVNQKKTGLPWLIVGCESLTVTDPVQFPRIPDSNYIGRPFQWFISDCYNLVQDFYRFELDIILRDSLVDKDYQDIRHMNDIFSDYFEDYGFKEIPFEELTDGNLVLLDHGGFTCNHLGIYWKGQVIHQGMVSVSVPFETFLGRINKVLKYVG
jgi:proteasome lid subunit RPN8/RPN11